VNPLSQRPPDVTDYSVRIAWHGPEDKPYYKALLVSPSGAKSIAYEPFWNSAVISTAELGRLLDALASPPGPPIASGPYAPDGPGYYVEITGDGLVYHASLGLDQATGEVLRHVAAALEPDHRQPVRAILARIGEASS
jgi:hypothetical protein